MSCFRTQNVLLLIVLSSLWVASDGGLFTQPKYWVKIWNDLSNHKPLTVHCKSKDDDLGVHVIPYENVYKWSFRTRFSFVGSTLFWCNFDWEHHHANGKVFYEYDMFLDHCGEQKECVWVAREDAIYVKSLRYQSYVKFYNWTTV